MSSIYRSVVAREEHQSEPSVFGDEVRNNAGGYVYRLTPLKYLERFLILGTEQNTFYVKAKALTREAAKNVILCLEKYPNESIQMIKEISTNGRAAKNDPALFALALASASANENTRKLALDALPAVARIGTHLFHFFTYVNELRGWGRGLKRAVANWYLDRDVKSLAYQLAKYQQRDGVSHRDMLRLSHPKTADPVRNSIFQWALRKEGAASSPLLPEIIQGMELAKVSKDVPSLVSAYALTREMVPTEALADGATWQAMLPHLGLEAMLRNLGNMTRLGVLAPLAEATNFVASALEDPEKLRRSRLHPYAILVALKVYASGGGVRGTGAWTPVPRIMQALNRALKITLKTQEPTGQRYLLGVDISGSMHWGGMENGLVTPMEGAAAIAIAIAASEKQSHIMGFATKFTDLGIHGDSTIKEMIVRSWKLHMGRTDCALPMIWALQKKVMVDCFVVLTDNETWAGPVKVPVALKRYRDQMNPRAKMIVVGMTATNFTIADPKDPLSLNVVGFDANVPKLIADFARN